MSINNKFVLITGAAGFIGAAVAKQLLIEGVNVIGLDNINSYYSQRLKRDRLQSIYKYALDNSRKWIFNENFLENKDDLDNIFKAYSPSYVINLAAQAGVRYSLENPTSYINSNLVGFSNILECCRNFGVEHFIYASSSSVYGGNKNLPFSEEQQANHPISLYAATKRSNELMAHSYSHLFKIPSTGLRFFTVYGPWGRPDMAPMIFAKAIFNDKPLKIFNYGKMQRDFTYIDDVVEAIIKCCFKPATSNSTFNYIDPNPSSSFAPHRIFNVGNSKPIEILEFLKILETTIGKPAKLNFDNIQPGDVVATAADTTLLKDWIGFTPKTNIKKGMSLFIDWYKKYY